MNKKEFELRVMNHFAENINFHKHWEIAKECAKEICHLKFNDIVADEFELPSSGELKEKVAHRVPYDFNASNFKETGPIDFSGIDEAVEKETLVKIEGIYKKFHDAQTMATAKAARHACERLIQKIRKEIHHIKEKHLSNDPD